MTTNTSFQKQRSHRSDPVACLLLNNLQLNFWGAGLLSIAISVSLALIVAWISQTLWSSNGSTGLLQDRFPWILIFIINPIVIGYYLWSFQAIDTVIYSLEESDVLEINETEIGEILRRYYYLRWRKYVAIVSAACFSFFVFVTRFGLKDTWTSSAPLPILATTVATFMVVYMGSMLIINLITNIWILHQTLGNKKLNVNPLHPDRCGGLRSLSDYALKTAYLAAVLGLLVGIIEYQFFTRGDWQQYWYVHLTIPLHLSLAIACFFGPLLAAHSGMRKAKEDLLNEIARQFQVDYEQIHDSLTGDAEVLKKGTEKIKELRAFYTLTDEFPVWPFDTQTFRRFLITVPAPLIPVLIAILQKLIETLLKKAGWLS